MRGLIVDLDGHLPPAIFNKKVSKPAVLVDVGEGVLGVEIAGFLGAEGVGEQFNEQILGTAAGGGAVGRHGGHLISFALAVQPAGPLLEDPAVLPERWGADRFSAVSRNAPRPACRGPLYSSEKVPSLCIFSTSSHSGSLERETRLIWVALICTKRPSGALAS